MLFLARVAPWKSFRLSRRHVTATILTLSLILFTVILFVERPHIYTIDAQTEVAEFTVQEKEGISINLRRVTIFDPTKKYGKTSESRAVINIFGNVTVLAVRRGQEPLFLRLLASNNISVDPQEPVAVLQRTGEEQAFLHSGTELWINIDDELETLESGVEPASETFMLAFRGPLTVGEDVASKVETILLEGKVSVLELQPLTGHRYVLQDVVLTPGDRVLFESESDNPAIGIVPGTAVSGFLHAGCEDAIKVVAHGEADHVRVVRFGTAGYHIRPSAFYRIATDPTSTLIVFFLALIGPLLQVWDLARSPSPAEPQ